ncbi:hypothetical protein G7054_g4950 [Neopestalotiopsis clavispora]|nr:hypothetical protein G7054_g4950 [Neopestalotiopsis clavispora]
MADTENKTLKRFALLIGIDYVPQSLRDDWPCLRGCANDVRNIKIELAKNDPKPIIRTLAISSSDNMPGLSTKNMKDYPTHKNIMTSLKSIVSDASRGDFVYIHFTGHGTAIRPSSPYASSTTGELALVVLDATDLTKIQYLRGSEMAYMLKQMVERGLRVVLVLDCCASGSVVRHQKGAAFRYLPYDPAVDLAHPPSAESSLSMDDAALQTGGSDFRGASMLPNWLANPKGYTVLTACGPTEAARELQTGDGEWHGVLSYFLVRTFIKLGRVGGRMQQIYAHLCARFLEQGSTQQPMIYGNSSLSFFEDFTYGPDAVAIPAIRKAGGTLELAAGRAHGVREGDQFSLCPPDSGRYASTRFEVTQARNMFSDLKILGGFPNQSGITVDIIRFYINVIDGGTYQIRNEDHEIIPNLPHAPLNLAEDATFVLDVVEHLAKFKLVKELTNPSMDDPKHSFRQSFKIYLADSQDRRIIPTLRGPERLMEVAHGDKIRLVVQNRAEQNGPNLYGYLYNLGSCWEVENLVEAGYICIPPCGSNSDSDDEYSGTSGQWREKITMQVPTESQEKGFCDDIFKIFLTRTPTTFSIYELEEIGRTGVKHRTGGLRGRPGVVYPDDWIVYTIRIRTSI